MSADTDYDAIFEKAQLVYAPTAWNHRPASEWLPQTIAFLRHHMVAEPFRDPHFSGNTLTVLGYDMRGERTEFAFRLSDPEHGGRPTLFHVSPCPVRWDHLFDEYEEAYPDSVGDAIDDARCFGADFDESLFNTDDVNQAGAGKHDQRRTRALNQIFAKERQAYYQANVEWAHHHQQWQIADRNARAQGQRLGVPGPKQPLNIHRDIGHDRVLQLIGQHIQQQIHREALKRHPFMADVKPVGYPTPDIQDDHQLGE